MPALTLAELEHKVEKLTTNGQLPVAQTVLAGAGCTPEKLAEGSVLLTSWKASRKAADFSLHAQKLATQAEAEARVTANKAIVSVSEMGREVFADDPGAFQFRGE